MALSLEQNKETAVKDSKSAALLNKYLEEAVWLTHSDSMIVANHYLKDFATRPRWEGIKQEDIDARYKENREKMKKFGFKDKAAYYANVRTRDNGKESFIKVGAVLAAAMVAAAVSPEAGGTVLGIGAAYLGSKLVAGTIGDPTTPKELFSTSDYKDLRHEQLALRKLSRHLKKESKAAAKEQYKEEVGKLFAAGYGQPGGGLVQAAMLKKQKAGR
ncbi:MAG: hypothetical protein IJ752_00975 [Alphaproteobacteria bacterium]|nr:hypothetical protein [Alphaproteobacteria bacterium]